MKHKKTTHSDTIASNRKARHDYHIETTYEAGLMLEGWEVKSLRAGHCQLRESYVVIKDSEAWLLNAHITALSTLSTHLTALPSRSRKLLLHKKELEKLIGAVQQKGYTLIPITLYWKNNRAKLQFGLAKGKQLHDKRETQKQRDWSRQKDRILKGS